MSVIDTESLLQTVSAEHPAGVDLEYVDPNFRALFEAASGTPERRMGDSVVPAQDPDWRRVLELGTGLLRLSKDLRIAVVVTRALLQMKGLPGLHGGLELIHGFLVNFWDGLYPELDAGDGNDPTARLNCLLELEGRDSFLVQLRTVPLIRSRVFGPVSYRDIEIAEGRAPAVPDTQPLNTAAISGAFQDCDLDDLVVATAALNGAIGTLQTIAGDLAARVQSGQAPSLATLANLLVLIRDVLNGHLATRQPSAETVTPGDTNRASPPQGPSAATAGAPGQIASRDDVVRTIDRICDYYSRQEPSSPVPLLLKRARRLATGSFVDIVRDLAPDALPQIERVCGVEEKP